MMAKNTKKVFVGLFALSAAVILSACDPVKALPTSYDKPIVSQTIDGVATGLKLTDNQLGNIWETISSGKTEYIHDKVIENIAYNQLGYYYDVYEGDTLVEKGISSIVVTDLVAVKDFINRHKGVFITDKDSVLAGTSDEDVIFAKIRLPRFLTFKKDIESRIAEKLYEEISGSSFVDKNGLFHEHKMAKAHYFSGYDIKDIVIDGALVKDDATKWTQTYITPDIEKDNLDDIMTVLHFDRYEDYISKKLLPSIYKEKLIEEYIYSQKTATLGRTYARNINSVKLSYAEGTRTYARKLMTTFADANINVAVAPDFVNFESVANTWRGFNNIKFVDGKINEIVTDSAEITVTGFAKSSILARLQTPEEGGYSPDDLGYLAPDAEESVILNFEYIKESKIGQELSNYLKACRAVIDSAKHQLVNSDDKSQLSTYTNSNEQSRVKGIKDNLAKLVLEDYTIDEEWGLKNGGFSDLPTTVRDRLFNINVSNAVDSFEHYEGENEDNPIGSYPTSGKYSYVRAIGAKNRYFLNKTDAQKYDKDHYSYLYDVDSSFVIVNIVEAASSAKLDLNLATSYKKTRPDDVTFIEEVSREIAQLLGTKDSYKSEAYEYFLGKYNLKFSDQDIYDYFVATYPDTYDED